MLMQKITINYSTKKKFVASITTIYLFQKIYMYTLSKSHYSYPNNCHFYVNTPLFDPHHTHISELFVNIIMLEEVQENGKGQSLAEVSLFQWRI